MVNNSRTFCTHRKAMCLEEAGVTYRLSVKWLGVVKERLFTSAPRGVIMPFEKTV